MPAIVGDGGLLPAAAPVGLQALYGDWPTLAAASVGAGTLHPIGEHHLGVVALP